MAIASRGGTRCTRERSPSDLRYASAPGTSASYSGRQRGFTSSVTFASWVPAVRNWMSVFSALINVPCGLNPDWLARWRRRPPTKVALAGPVRPT